WAVGSGNGALDAGAIAANTWYSVHLIKRADTGVVDVLLSLSPTAPTLPTNYTMFRRLGSMRTNVSSQWTPFVQLGDEFLWVTPVADVNTSALGTTATLFTLSVPPGVQVTSRIRGIGTNPAANTLILLNSPDEAPAAPNSPPGNLTVDVVTGGTG